MSSFKLYNKKTSSQPYGKEYFIEKMKERDLKKKKHIIERKFCWNSIKNFWYYIRNKDLRNFVIGAGIVTKLEILDAGSGYIKNKDVCTFDQSHADCSEMSTLKIDVELINGSIKSVKPSKDFKGYFYQVGDILLVKGGDDNGFVKVLETWPIATECT